MSGGGGWIHHACHAGVASLFPAGSVALTAKVWLPSVRLLKVLGLAQAA